MAGRESDDHDIQYVRSSPPSPRSGLILTVSFFLLPFLSLDFSLLLCGAVFHTAGAFNGDLSAWDVGKVTTMLSSTYTLFSSYLSLQIEFFFGCFFFPSFVPVQSTDYIFEQFFHSTMLFFLFQSVSQQRFHTNLVRWQMGIFARYFKCI
jgi:hypothetical protein